MPHAPGPWTYHPADRNYGDAARIVWSSKGPGYGVIAETASYNRTAAADARLISAAPDLLEVLTFWLHVIEDQEGKSDAMDVWVDKAREAIAKANGDAPA